MLGYNVDGKDWVEPLRCMQSVKQLVGEGRSKGRKDGLLLKGIQVLLCYTSRLRTSGKSCI